MLSDIWKDHLIFPDYFTFEETEEVIPDGYKLPDNEEFKVLVESTKYSWDDEDSNGIFTFEDGFQLILPAMGYRGSDSDSLYAVGSSGFYWSAPPYGSTEFRYSWLYLSSGCFSVNNGGNSFDGLSIICIKDERDN